MQQQHNQIRGGYGDYQYPSDTSTSNQGAILPPLVPQQRKINFHPPG
jgi:hypothetical protein